MGPNVPILNLTQEQETTKVLPSSEEVPPSAKSLFILGDTLEFTGYRSYEVTRSDEDNRGNIHLTLSPLGVVIEEGRASLFDPLSDLLTDPDEDEGKMPLTGTEQFKTTVPEDFT